MLVLRVLNGPLIGAEAVLPQEGFFVRVVDLGGQPVNRDVEEGIDAWARGAVLTIPSAGISANFRVAPQVDEDGAARLRVEAYDDESGLVEMFIPMNTPAAIGGLRIAVRGADQAWSPSVLQYRGVEQEESRSPRPKPGGRKQWTTAVTASMAGAACFAGLVLLTWPPPAASLSTLLAGQACQVVDDDGRPAYVFVENARVASSIRRLLTQADIDDARILVRADEAARIGHWLETVDIHYFSIDLDDPRQPLLRLRRKAAPTPAEPAGLDKRLRAVAPYSRSMKVQWLREEDAQRAAKALAEEVGARATYRVTPDHFVVTIDAHLSDAQIDTFSHFLRSYRRAWGDGYTQFQVNQRDMTLLDGLKTGRQSYELRSAGHVYFPPN